MICDECKEKRPLLFKCIRHPNLTGVPRGAALCPHCIQEIIEREDPCVREKTD